MGDIIHSASGAKEKDAWNRECSYCFKFGWNHLPSWTVDSSLGSEIIFQSPCSVFSLLCSMSLFASWALLYETPSPPPLISIPTGQDRLADGCRSWRRMPASRKKGGWWDQSGPFWFWCAPRTAEKGLLIGSCILPYRNSSFSPASLHFLFHILPLVSDTQVSTLLSIFH